MNTIASRFPKIYTGQPRAHDIRTFNTQVLIYSIHGVNNASESRKSPLFLLIRLFYQGVQISVRVPEKAICLSSIDFFKVFCSGRLGG